jgi:hypothetical protein
LRRGNEHVAQMVKRDNQRQKQPNDAHSLPPQAMRVATLFRGLQVPLRGLR